MATVTDPLTRLKYLLARCDTFRVWVGVTTGTEAEKLAATLARIHVRLADPAATQPFALIEGTRNHRASRSAAGGNAFVRMYRCRLTFFADYTHTDTLVTERAAIQDAVDTIDPILDEMHTLSGSGSYLRWDSMSEEQQPVHTAYDPEDDSAENYIFATYEFIGRLEGSQDE